jgi:tetratricopeptide (TPR) repeat protein
MIFKSSFNGELVYKGGVMRKIIICIFLVLTFICSCSEKPKTASDWLEKEKALWDGKKYSDPKKAIEYLNNAIKLQPNNAETYTKRGGTYYDLGQYQQAVEDFSKVVTLKPDYADAYINRGVAYFKLGQYQQAIEDYNKVIILKSDYKDAYNKRGATYLMLGNKELGCPDLKKACSLGDCKLLELAKSKELCR